MQLSQAPLGRSVQCCPRPYFGDVAWTASGKTSVSRCPCSWGLQVEWEVTGCRWEGHNGVRTGFKMAPGVMGPNHPGPLGHVSVCHCLLGNGTPLKGLKQEHDRIDHIYQQMSDIYLDICWFTLVITIRASVLTVWALKTVLIEPVQEFALGALSPICCPARKVLGNPESHAMVCL